MLSAYGRLAMRLARAVAGDDEAARLAVRTSAEAGDDRNDWVAFLGRVRRESLRGSAQTDDTASRPQLPSPRHPGDAETTALPIDAALLHDAFFSLAEADRTTLWTALLGRSDTTEPAQLAGALARLREAVTRAGFPSAEDIP